MKHDGFMQGGACAIAYICDESRIAETQLQLVLKQNVGVA